MWFISNPLDIDSDFLRYRTLYSIFTHRIAISSLFSFKKSYLKIFTIAKFQYLKYEVCQSKISHKSNYKLQDMETFLKVSSKNFQICQK